MQTLNIHFAITGTKIYLPFTAVCSVTDQEFGGEVVIEYAPKKRVLEYVDAEKRINDFCKEKQTAEELAHRVFQEVWKDLKPKSLTVLIDVKYSKAHQPTQVWIKK